jgi:hypothetical protein
MLITDLSSEGRIMTTEEEQDRQTKSTAEQDRSPDRSRIGQVDEPQELKELRKQKDGLKPCLIQFAISWSCSRPNKDVIN